MLPNFPPLIYKINIFLCLLLFSFTSQAQHTQDSIQLYKHYAYLNLGALANLPSGIQIGYERHLKDNFYWEIEGGYLLFDEASAFVDVNSSDKWGMRFTGGIKSFQKNNFYFGLFYSYKRISMWDREWVERFNGLYDQRMNLQRVRVGNAFFLEGGWHMPVNNTPMSVDFSYGVGYYNLMVNYKDLPEDGLVLGQSLLRRPGMKHLPYINFRLKLKYALDFRQMNKNSKDRKSKSKKRKKGKKKRR